MLNLKIQKQLDKIQEEQGIMSWSYIWDVKDADGVNPIGYTSNLNEVYEAGEIFTDLADEHVKRLNWQLKIIALL